MFSCITTNAQDSTKVESLDAYFGGIPLQEGFTKWIEYITSSPNLGIDSSNSRGFYSSFKKEIKTHFPFPDSIPVRILLYEETIAGSKTNKPSIKETVLIEGVFNDKKNSSTEMTNCFRKLYAQLNTYYLRKDNSPGERYLFKSKNNNFPPVTIHKGYDIFLKFDYIILEYVMVQPGN